MSIAEIGRQSTTFDGIAVGTNPGASAAVGIAQYASGGFRVPAGSPITQITWYVSGGTAGDFLPVADVLQENVAAGNAYRIPSDLFCHGALLAVGDHAGTIDITLKA
jgi:hypothetical protein